MDTIKRKILVMDDEELVCEIAKQIFEYLGHEVQLAEDGEVALGMYKAAQNTTPFDAVVMDLTIPDGIGGKEAIGQFLEFDADAKVVVTSGYALDPLMSNYSDYGFAGSLAKPFDIEAVEKLMSDLF